MRFWVITVAQYGLFGWKEEQTVNQDPVVNSAIKQYDNGQITSPWVEFALMEKTLTRFVVPKMITLASVSMWS